MRREPTREDVDKLVGPATPHFAYQLRARVRELVLDLPPDHDVRRYAEAQMELLDRLDALVHNAATGVVRQALETDDKHWDWTMNANARALLALARAAAPQMPAGSSIVAISSLGASRVLANYT